MVEYPYPVRPSLDATYAALSHPVRRTVLDRLAEGPARVTDLARPFDLSLNAISKHIKSLEQAGLVSRSVRGRDHWLELRPERLAQASGWIERYRRFWAPRLDALESLLLAEGDE